MSLLHFPPELMTRILLYLSPLDIISCGRTCRMLCNLCSDSILRYVVQMERCAVCDDLSPGLSYPERLRILERREEAWTMLEFRRSVGILIPFIPTTQHEFTGGALLLGTAPDARSRQPTVAHSYVTLPSLSEAQDQKLDWKAYNLETEILDVGLAVHEHDLIAALTVKDLRRPSKRNSILELRLLSFSTGQPHPLVEKSTIFIDKMVLPHGRRNIKIEIVGDFVIFLITFLGRSGNQDIFFLVQWKMGLPHRLGSPEKGFYASFSHLSQDTLVIPNLIQNTLEVVKIVIDNDDMPRVMLLFVLDLPPLTLDASINFLHCRSEPNQTSSGPVAIRSPSYRPFRDKAEDAIIIFNMSHSHFSEVVMGCLTLIVHRRALLAHIPLAHHVSTPFCSLPEPTPAVVEVPWSAWGPPATRIFVGNITPMHWMATTAGQRAVMLEGRIPTPIIVRDFNPYAVRAARALASASGLSQQRNWSKQLPNGNRMTLQVEDSVLPAGSIFKEDVRSSLPYVEIVTRRVYHYAGAMIDDERILGFKSSEDDAIGGSYFDVHVLG